MKPKEIITRTTMLGAVATGLVLAGAGGAMAAPETADGAISVRAGSVVLAPAASGGYAGQLALQVRYDGPASTSVQLNLDHPQGLYLTGAFDGIDACFHAAPEQGASVCWLSGELAPGETRTITVNYQALAAPQAKTRLTAPGSVTVIASGTEAQDTAGFRGALRGTGTGLALRPYQPADATDMTFAAASEPLTFTAQDDGTYRASFTTTVHARTDGFHDSMQVELLTPLPGLRSLNLAPSDSCFFTPQGGVACTVGGKLPQHTTRTIQASIVVTEPPVPGTVVELTAVGIVDGAADADANPADNTIRLIVG
ncbi:hypothetical protein WEI85_08695 [Actinomycetes bacterium KLBMP 9797]